MNKNYVLVPLFPSSVLTTNIGRNFSNEELDYLEIVKKDRHTNIGNQTGNDTHILDREQFSELKKDILEVVNVYLNEIIRPNKELSAYITQSWLNYSDPGEYHHKHNHSNSYLSGVFYINADEQHDKIFFHKENYSQIKLYPKQKTVYNSDSWWLPVKTGDIVVFPSNLLHSVERTTSEKTRISLAFNTFLKGTIGDEKFLTELIND